MSSFIITELKWSYWSLILSHPVSSLLQVVNADLLVSGYTHLQLTRIVVSIYAVISITQASTGSSHLVSKFEVKQSVLHRPRIAEAVVFIQKLLLHAQANVQRGRISILCCISISFHQMVYWWEVFHFQVLDLTQRKTGTSSATLFGNIRLDKIILRPSIAQQPLQDICSFSISSSPL